MARVIEFYVPKKFRKPLRWAPALHCGKIIEFYSPELEAIHDAMAAKHKFELTSHLLRMIGICGDCRRQERETGTEARTENADSLIAPRGEPGDRAPRVEHRLPAHLYRPRDIGADNVVSAAEFGRHAPIVVREAETERADAVPREQPAQTDMPSFV